MEYTRSEVAKLMGMKLSTLQNYDTWGIVSPRRDKSNYRVYTEDDLEKLREVSLLRRFGFEVNKDVIPIMLDDVYDREKVLSFLIAKLNEAKREIEKEIRLTTLIRILGTDALGLNDPEKTFQESVTTGLDFMENPICDDLFQMIDTLSDEDTAKFDEIYQSFLEQFQVLLKKNISPDDPQIAGLIRFLIDETYALVPSRLREKTGKYTHALMAYYLNIFSSDTVYKRKCDAQYGPELAEFISDCCLSQYETDWLEESEDILDQSLRELVDSGEDILSDSLLNRWVELLREYLGNFNPAYITPEDYLSLPKELLLEGYETSAAFTTYMNRLFEILTRHLANRCPATL